MKKWATKLLTSLFIAATALSIGIMINNHPTAAQAASLNQIATARWKSKTITYRTNSTSPYYKKLWAKAAKAWSATKSVKLVESKKSNLYLTTSAKPAPGFSGTRYSEKVNGMFTLIKAHANINRKVKAPKGLTTNQFRLIQCEQAIGLSLGFNYNKDKTSVMYDNIPTHTISKADKINLARVYKQ